MAARLSNCSACGGPYESVEEGIVCVKCGVFLESDKLTDFEPGNAMNVDGTLKVAEGTMGLYSNRRGTSRAKKAMQACLFKLMKTLRLSAATCSQIRSFLFERVYPAKKAWSMSTKRNIVAASCVYIVCRQSGMTLSLGHMAQVAECCRFALGRNVKIVSEKLAITLASLEADDYILRVLGQFGVEDKSVESLTFDLLKLCKDYLLNKGKQPLIAAVSVVIVALESKGTPPGKAKITKVSGENSVNEGGVLKAVRSLKDYLLEMTKEIPWLARLGENALKPVNRMNVTKFIPDIISFHQQCSKPNHTIVKPTWLREKEKNDAVRSKKIESAKLRIALKKQITGENAGIPDAPLGSEDAMIEYLLEKGFNKSQLLDNNLESLYYSCNSPSNGSGLDMEREVLDEADISEENLHEYLRNLEEVNNVKQIKFEDESDADAATSSEE